ncbi:hypothetical protein [Persicobacter psychrovividus]|uniref:Uncharacterized protein n=1 Tax=Persicobacter psychrovividus TaxID=387638 RepID=A0ABN6LEP6_9BACT|nr:hypothetical protein PEPS_37260 [Persicobacter psychrovividus]
MIKILIDTILKTYWINSKINNGKKLYFNNVFFPSFLESVNNHFIISEHYELRDAFSKSPVKGLMNSIFNPNKFFFNALDLSVAINISINGYCNEKYVNNDEIVNSANYICELLKKQMYQDKIIRELLKELDKDLKNFDFYIEREKIKKTLNDKIEIFKTYFGRFDDKNYSSGVKVYYQANNESWINWKDENSIDINHNCVEFESGFFLCGFNYKLFSGESLKIATSENGKEFFNPQKYKWGDNVIWAQ